MSAAQKRSGAVRKSKKGPSVGTGGYGRKALEGKGPTPKAEDRPYHKAFKNKELAERSAAKRGTRTKGGAASRGRSGGRSQGQRRIGHRPQLGRRGIARRHPGQGHVHRHPHRR